MELDTNTVLQFVQGVGFPILAFLMVYKTSTEQNEKWSEKIGDMTKSLIELTESVKNQSEILMKIIGKIGDENNDPKV